MVKRSKEKTLEESRLNTNAWRQLKKIKLLRGLTLPGEPITHVGLTTNAVSPSINIEQLKKQKKNFEQLSAGATVVNKTDGVLGLPVLVKFLA